MQMLDVLASFAAVSAASTIPFTRPQLLHSSDPPTLGADAIKMKIIGLRHPLVDSALGTSFIANDVDLQFRQPAVEPTPSDATVESDEQGACFSLVGGPNMGGKSTYIRSVALAVLMAQAGCFVPATSAAVPVFESVFARVGSADDQLKGVSSFMAEMVETSSLLRAVGPRSLVVLDEIGRGTSTHDGFGIAWAVAHKLACTGCISLMATHFHELGGLVRVFNGENASGFALKGNSEEASSSKVPEVKRHRSEPGHPDRVANFTEHRASGRVRAQHMAAETSGREVVMLYQVRPGMSEKSFGVQVAAGAGFPPEVIREAEEALKQAATRV